MTTLDLIDDCGSLEKDLGDIKLFKRDVKRLLCYVTPYIPFIGLACGGICIAKHVISKGGERS